MAIIHSKWWFQRCYLCLPRFGEMIQFDDIVFFLRWVEITNYYNCYALSLPSQSQTARSWKVSAYCQIFCLLASGSAFLMLMTLIQSNPSIYTVIHCFIQPRLSPKRVNSRIPQPIKQIFMGNDEIITLPKTNMAPENRPLEKEIPIGNHRF